MFLKLPYNLSGNYCYLSSHDCQTGYLGFYITPKDDVPYPQIRQELMALNAASTFTAGTLVLGSAQIHAVHSILVRFISTGGQLAKFTGSCKDQSINCCIPVDCSNDSGLCLATHDIGIQPYRLMD